MKLFISWSGPTSQSIANELRTWLPLILPSLKLFITTGDIEKGAQWQGVIRSELEDSAYGLVILTEDNIASQWLAFEAGALSKHLDGRVATVLFGLGHSSIKPPLSMFQGTLFVESDFRKLVSNINNAVAEEARRSEGELDTLFPMLWPKLSQPVELLLKAAEQAPAEAAISAQEENLQEMMALLRQQNSILSSPERFLQPILDVLQSQISSIRLKSAIEPSVRFRDTSSFRVRPEIRKRDADSTD